MQVFQPVLIFYKIKIAYICKQKVIPQPQGGGFR